MNRLNRDQLAARVAKDIAEGAYVNLGIGLPTLVANHLPKDREIFLHSENGLLGMGPAPAKRGRAGIRRREAPLNRVEAIPPPRRKRWMRSYCSLPAVAAASM